MDKNNKKIKDTKSDSNLLEVEKDDVYFEESDEDGFALPQKDKLKKIREDLKNCRKEKEEYLTGWQRSKADYVNLQKELNKIRIDSANQEKEDILINLLPVLDSFEMAFSNKEAWGKVDKEWRIGIEYIYQQFMASLLNSGIEKIDNVGVIFDPQIYHSVKIIKTDDKKKDHVIAEIVQFGYKIGEKVIRPAGVNVYEYKK